MRTSLAHRSHTEAARILLVLGGAALACASLTGGEKEGDPIDVEAGSGWISIRASDVPLADLLQRLSTVVGMKVVYGGAPPRQAVSVELKRRAPTDCVVALLAGQGMDFAVQANAGGGPAQTLFVAGAGESDSTEANAPAAPGVAASLDETDPPPPADEEVDEPEDPIDYPEVDPIAVPEEEPAAETAEAERAPAASPPSTPSPPE
jgi:hypothetical protein